MIIRFRPGRFPARSNWSKSQISLTERARHLPIFYCATEYPSSPSYGRTCRRWSGLEAGKGSNLVAEEGVRHLFSTWRHVKNQRLTPTGKPASPAHQLDARSSASVVARSLGSETWRRFGSEISVSVTLTEDLLLVKLRPIFIVVEIDRIPG